MSMILSRQISPAAPQSPQISSVIGIAAAVALLLVILSVALPPAASNADTAQIGALIVGP
jgi:hypothetical protein